MLRCGAQCVSSTCFNNMSLVTSQDRGLGRSINVPLLVSYWPPSSGLGATDLRVTRTERKLLVGSYWLEANTRTADTGGAATRKIGVTHQVISGHFKFWHSVSKPKFYDITQSYTCLLIVSTLLHTFWWWDPPPQSSVSKPPRKHHLHQVADVGVPHLIIANSFPSYGANPADGYQPGSSISNSSNSNTSSTSSINQ